jgi:hypothetical protein
MPLSDTFLINSTKPSGATAGDKHTDGGGMYLLVTKAGGYWRMKYRFAGNRKILPWCWASIQRSLWQRPGKDTTRPANC